MLFCQKVLKSLVYSVWLHSGSEGQPCHARLKKVCSQDTSVVLVEPAFKKKSAPAKSLSLLTNHHYFHPRSMAANSTTPLLQHLRIKYSRSIIPSSMACTSRLKPWVDGTDCSNW